MTPTSSLIEIKNTIPKSSWPQVILALRHDKLVWQALQNPDFRTLTIERLNVHPKMWTPLNLALLSINPELDLEKIRTTPLIDLDSELRLQAVQAYEEYVSDSSPKMTLSMAGLLSLAFREHYLTTQSWEKIPQTNHWRTVYACLFNLIEQPIGLLTRLSIPLFIHTILANPLPQNEQTELILSISSSQSTKRQIELLREIRTHRPDLSSMISRKLWRTEGQVQDITDNYPLDFNSLSQDFEKTQIIAEGLISSLLQSEAQVTAGSPQKVAESLNAAWQAARNIQNNLASKVSQVNALLGDFEKSRSKWEAAQIKPLLQSEDTASLALIWLEQGYLDEAKSLLAKVDDKFNPNVLLVECCILFQEGKLNPAREIALQALENASKLNSNHLIKLANHLIALMLPSEAIYCLELANNKQPDHKVIIRVLARANAASGAYPQAINLIHLAIAFEPDKIELQREYALYHELAGLWPAAYEARKNIIDLQNEPIQSDFHKLARCALKLNLYSQAKSACKSALEISTEDGISHALIGEAYFELGNQEKAQEHINKAIQFAPDQAQPWLALASYNRKTSNISEAIEVLLKGTKAAPEQAEIYLALGENHFQTGAHSQALTCLQKAEQLLDGLSTVEDYYLRSRIALPLAKTLFELGHAKEALEKINKAFALDDNQVEFLHLNAQILMLLRQTEEAILLLEKALISKPADPAITLDYARALLDVDDDPAKAVRILQSLLENDPQNAEALAWLAEAFKISGDPENALSAYQQALGTNLIADPHWHPRLSIGLAQSALELDQPETALAALQGNWQTSSRNNFIITKTIALAYKQAQLLEKALQTALSTQDIEPRNLENILWFVDFAEEIHAYDKAIDALKSAINIDRDRADLYLKLGSVHQKIGDLTEARKSFSKVTEIDQSTNQHLQIAAKNLIKLNHPKDAIPCLKIALLRCAENPDTPLCDNLIFDLIKLYRQLGMQPEALEAIDTHIEQQAKVSPKLLGERAVLLNQLGREDEALSVINEAFKEFHNNYTLHLAASLINYQGGKLKPALKHAIQAIDSLNNDKSAYPMDKTFAFAADIADACLQNHVKSEILQKTLVNTTDKPTNLSYLCMRAEHSLAMGEEIDAAKSLTTVLDISPEHPRVLALQARLTARHGDIKSAKNLLQKSLTSLGAPFPREITSPIDMLGISEAALELHEWNPALYLLQQVVDLFPQEPRAQIRLARGLVLRAEFHRFCETLKVKQHAPGESVIAAFTYQQFEQAILNAVKICDEANLETHQSEISKWRIRGQAIFQPSPDHSRALSEIADTPDNLAAYLSSLRYQPELLPDREIDKTHIDSLLPLPNQDINNTIALLAEYAFWLLESDPEQAKVTAQKALESSIRYSYPSQPIIYALQAYIAENIGEMDFAEKALSKALSIWEDEPRWHSWGANIQLANEGFDYEDVIRHLSQAITLEPRFGEHHLKLGEVYLCKDNPEDAIPVLEEAAHLLSEQAAPWLALAQAYKLCGDIAQIFRNAERAAELDPSNIEPYILLAQTALDINNPEKTIQYCSKALEVSTGHPEFVLLEARAMDRLGKSSESLELFDQALDSMPKTVERMLERAQIIRRALGSHAEVEALKRLNEEFPDDPNVWLAFTEALVNDNQVEDAVQAAQNALQTNDGHLDNLQVTHIHLTLGRLMRRTGQLDQAIHHLSMAVQHDSESIESYLELGRVYQDRRQFSAALEAYQQAIALDPGNAQAYYQAGQTLKSSKDYAAAEEMLQNAAKLAPNDLAIRRQLGGLVALNLVHNRRENADIYVE